MTDGADTRSGLRLGLIIFALVTLGFAALFIFGPSRSGPAALPPETPEPNLLFTVFEDQATRDALTALRAVSPSTYAELDTAIRFARADNAAVPVLSQLVLEALFSQFQSQALSLRSAESADYHAIIAGLADGLRALKAQNSPWCDGPAIADFLAQNEADLVPALLAEFPYQSAQYDWAMKWMTRILGAMQTGQANARPYARPTLRDETILQQEGIALGSEQWALAAQVFAFANAEGTSYGQMQDVIAGIDVCDLGIALETVSERLPEQVRARIWADLMPEIMVGNTPYVMWRVTDYFFIG
ncbi:MAG: hypothetical protein AAGH49_07945 [Pseudomonadota bacterium]